MQLAEQLGKVDSISCKITGLRQIHSLTSHPRPLHPLLTFHIRDTHRATPLEIYVTYLPIKIIYFTRCTIYGYLSQGAVDIIILSLPVHIIFTCLIE
jgi:hypothetical protein